MSKAKPASKDDVEKGSPAKQSLLAAKELAAQVPKFVEGDDIEEHLRRLDDMSELLMVDETVKYQAMLLSLNDVVRSEFSAWLKTEKISDQVKGKPEELKKRLLEKFRVRKTALERLNFVIQPRRRHARMVVDLLERKRVYDEVYDELMKNREKLFVEAAMQLLGPDDRADYGNIRPEEEKRTIADLVEFVRRKEEERLREEKLALPQKKKTKEEDEEQEDQTLSEEEDYSKKKSTNPRIKKKLKKVAEEDTDEERARLMAEGRCFLCHELGHVAADCPLNRRTKKMMKKKKASEKNEERRGSDDRSF